MGNLVWGRYFYSYSTSGNNVGYQVIEASDGDYVVFGTTYDYESASGDYPDEDFLMAKFNSSGTLQWARIVDYSPGATYDYDYCCSGVQASDGGFVMAGYYSNYLHLIKLDASGNLVWAKRIQGYNSTNYPCNIIRTSDNGYAVAITTTTFGAGSEEFLLLKFASDGSLQWARTAGGASSEFNPSVIQTNDGGYALFGQTISFGAGGYDFLLVKFDASGSYLWAKTYGGASNEQTTYGGPNIFQNAEGFFTMGGYTDSYGAGGVDYFHVRAGANGDCCFGETAPVGISAPTPTTSDITASVVVADPSLSIWNLTPNMNTPAPTAEQVCGP